jgi:hypothetical protein
MAEGRRGENKAAREGQTCFYDNLVLAQLLNIVTLRTELPTYGSWVIQSHHSPRCGSVKIKNGKQARD